MACPLIDLGRIDKSFATGDRRVSVLKGIDLKVSNGEFVAVMGPSGSGKSTLLNLIGCLDRPDSGSYRFDGRDIADAADADLARIRARQIGFVFQTFNLIPNLNVFENVELPFLYAAGDNRDVGRRIVAAVERVGLADRVTHKPHQLSGGEMQRVAIARAVAAGPRLMLADEPTGNLDSATGMEILDLFQTLNTAGVTIVMVTHDESVAARAGRKMVLKDGRFVSSNPQAV